MPVHTAVTLVDSRFLDKDTLEHAKSRARAHLFASLTEIIKPGTIYKILFEERPIYISEAIGFPGYADRDRDPDTGAILNPIYKLTLRVYEPEP